MAELKRLWNELYANNESNMMILNNGLKYIPSASSSVEMQLNENKSTNSEQIAQIFGLSPAVLSGSCSTQEYMSAVRVAVLPIVEHFQAALNRSLLREDEKGEYYFSLDTTELLKGDTLIQYHSQLAVQLTYGDVRIASPMVPYPLELLLVVGVGRCVFGLCDLFSKGRRVPSYCLFQRYTEALLT